MNEKEAFYILHAETLRFLNNMLIKNKNNKKVVIEKEMFENFKWYVETQKVFLENKE